MKLRTHVTDDDLLSFEDVAMVLGVSVKTVRELVRRGAIPHVPVGTKPLRKVQRRDLREWIDEQKKSGTGTLYGSDGSPVIVGFKGALRRLDAWKREE